MDAGLAEGASAAGVFRSSEGRLALPFGLLGYVFKKLGYPIAPMVLAMVLGDKAEDAFRQSMIMSKGSLSIFWTNSTLVACIMGLAFLLLMWPAINALIQWMKRR